jgi:2-oxoglutarate ferredoxin oxidoreductase subunit gamma
MTEKIICAGFGGQGIMLMGQLLARSGLNQGRYVSWLPSYGAEVRGGTAFCHVILSDKEIPSPYIQLADTCILMNEPSLLKFQKYLKKGGLVLLNSSLAKKSSQRKDINVYKIPFTDIALNLGNIKIANSVALGAYIALKKIFSKDELFKIIQEVAPKGKRELIAINKKAIEAGMGQIKN